MILTFKYRLLPTKRQRRALAGISEAQRILYNAALQERIECYRKTGKGLSYMAQSVSLTTIRRDDPDGYGAIPVNLSRATLRRLHWAFDGFFRRMEAGGKAGFPRFKSRDRWRSFGFAEFSGIALDGKRLRFKGLPGGLRVHLHRPLPSNKPLSCQFIRDAKGWSVALQVNAEAAERRTVSRPVGIDLGLNALAFLSDGIAIPNPRDARLAEHEMRRRSRALARCRRGSARRRKVKARVTALHEHIANTRRTYLHQQSARIARCYDLIAVEDLNVKGLAGSMLAKSVHDASWAAFTNMLAYKAERAGAHFVKVDPRMTSQGCSGCGAIVKKGLAQRVHSCPDCGLTLDRDHNAAINILRLGVLAQGIGNAAHVSGERRSGNLKLKGISN